LSDERDLGRCCSCEGTHGVHYPVLLEKKAPVPGTGWGCGECDLPDDGAVAVSCAACIEEHRPLRFAVRGPVLGKGRIRIEELREDFRHDTGRHGWSA